LLKYQCDNSAYDAGKSNGGGELMKKLIVFLMITAFTYTAYAGTVSLSDPQMEALGLISISVKSAYPSFGGFHGDKGKMIADGVDDSAGLQAYIDSLDITTLKENDKRRKDIKQLRKKFKVMGLDNSDLKLLNLDNDIPDA
jgi:hypothetical protein